MIERTELLQRVEYGLKRNPVTAILGPRQCGKTTLARELGCLEKAVYFDLEDAHDQARLANPQLTLEAQRLLLGHARRGGVGRGGDRQGQALGL